MPTDYLALMRAAVRQDLHDEDSAAYRWTDAVLNRHILRALKEFSKSIPVEKTTTLATAAGTRAVVATTLTDVLDLLMVEYPTTNWPPTYVQFTWWAGVLTLILDSAPSAIANVIVHWTQLHALTTSATTLSTWMEDIVALGAAGYAALDWASYATNRVNVGGEATWKHYLDFGSKSLADFKAQLKRHGTVASLRSSKLYSPYDPSVSKLTDPGPQ